MTAAWAVECFSGKLTGHSEHISLDLCGDVEATSPLSVICPTQAGHVGHAALMDVHHTVWKHADVLVRNSNNRIVKIIMIKCNSTRCIQSRTISTI